jgi:hypothetical protein
MKAKPVGVFRLAVFAVALLFASMAVFASGDEGPPGMSSAMEPDACSGSDSIVYVSDATGNADLWLLDNVTGHSEPLLNWPDSVERSPDWNANCDRIVFASTRGATEDGWHIWTVAPDGSDPRQLTSVAGRHRFPRWSPDGNSILFSSDQDGSHGLWVVSADGTGQRRIFQNLASPAVHGSWSPDGDSLAFVRCEAFCQVYRLVIGDTTPQQLTFSEDDKLGTDWGPNGILFTAVVNGQRVVASVDATGSEPEQVTFPGPGLTDFDPRWDPRAGGVIMVRVDSDVYGVWSRTSLGEETRVGPALVAVPGVAGLVQANAEAAIIAAGLTVGATTTAHSGTVPAGAVINQSPAAGTNVAPGVPVELEVSLGSALVAVPEVTGLTQADAQAAILAAGLTVGAITTAHSNTVPAGAVISQSPAAGTNMASGSPVNLVVSSGAAPPVPGDLDRDGDIDQNDVNILLKDRNKPVAQSACGTPCDLDGNGTITNLDARKLVLLCTRPNCAMQ